MMGRNGVEPALALCATSALDSMNGSLVHCCPVCVPGAPDDVRGCLRAAALMLGHTSYALCTGDPKGVMLTHNAVVTALINANQYCKVCGTMLAAGQPGVHMPGDGAQPASTWGPWHTRTAVVVTLLPYWDLAVRALMVVQLVRGHRVVMQLVRGHRRWCSLWAQVGRRWGARQRLRDDDVGACATTLPPHHAPAARLPTEQQHQLQAPRPPAVLPAPGPHL